MAYQNLTRRIEEIKARIQQVFPYEVATIIQSQDNQVLILDVREDSEYEMGYLETAVNLPYPRIEEKIEEIISDKSATIISYCHSFTEKFYSTFKY